MGLAESLAAIPFDVFAAFGRSLMAVRKQTVDRGLELARKLEADLASPPVPPDGVGMSRRWLKFSEAASM
jgi:hypothetical protein